MVSKFFQICWQGHAQKLGFNNLVFQIISKKLDFQTAQATNIAWLFYCFALPLPYSNMRNQINSTDDLLEDKIWLVAYRSFYVAFE